MSTVHYTRNTRIIHCRPCCNVHVLHNVVFQLNLAKTVLRSRSHGLLAIAKLLVNLRAKCSRLVVCRIQLWFQNFDRKLGNGRFSCMRSTNLAKHKHTSKHPCEIVEFVGWCVMGLVIKAQNDWFDVAQPSSWQFPHFYRAACNAYGIAMRILSVCVSVCLSNA